MIAIGTTLVRALESAGTGTGLVRPGAGIATKRITAETQLRVVDAVLAGTHEPGTSHYALLGAFVSAAALRAADRELEAHGYRTHEFGDSVLLERGATDGSEKERMMFTRIRGPALPASSGLANCAHHGEKRHGQIPL